MPDYLPLPAERLACGGGGLDRGAAVAESSGIPFCLPKEPDSRKGLS
jgi:hypothetical protein